MLPYNHLVFLFSNFTLKFYLRNFTATRRISPQFFYVFVVVYGKVYTSNIVHRNFRWSLCTASLLAVRMARCNGMPGKAGGTPVGIMVPRERRGTTKKPSPAPALQLPLNISNIYNHTKGESKVDGDEEGRGQRGTEK